MIFYKFLNLARDVTFLYDLISEELESTFNIFRRDKNYE